MAPPDVATGARPEGVRAPSVLVIGCGALARELLDIVAKNRLPNIRVECLPAILHNRPEKIPGAVRARLESAQGYDRVYVAYGDCGTGGLLDDVLEDFGVERLPGAHCYQFYAGIDVFDRLHEEEPGTLYLTDYLARHFDRIVWQGLGLDRWPELLDDYFGNYVRVVYLAQTNDGVLIEKARAAADRLGLGFESRHVGYGELERELVRVSLSSSPSLPPAGGVPAQPGRG
ncbi:MAG TPA: DUF1638 domain-containing protein, partial [Acidimicrobiia bacterium]|nr:DUF1638 domain-containing protein [Acidimicrobiia bacterium]